MAPASIGSPTINPFCAGERFSVSPICGPKGPSTAQTIKLKSKYKKAARRVGQWPVFLRSDSFISTALTPGNCRLKRHLFHRGRDEFRAEVVIPKLNLTVQRVNRH